MYDVVILKHPEGESEPCTIQETLKEGAMLPDGRMQVQGIYRQVGGGWERI